MSDDCLVIRTPEGVDLELSLAGVYSRGVAWLVDGLLQLALLVLLYLSLAPGLSEPSLLMALTIFVAFLLQWGYATLWEIAWSGRTPGKFLLGLRVIRSDGLSPDRSQIALRNLLRVVDFLPSFYLVAMVSALVDPLNRRVGDLVAGTVVIHERMKAGSATQSGAAWASRAEKGQGRRGLLLPGGAVTAAQLSVLEQFLERRGQLSPERGEALARQLLEPLQPLLGSDLLAQLQSQQPQAAQRVLEAIWGLSHSSTDLGGADTLVSRSGLF